jgi:hypothetical protein
MKLAKSHQLPEPPANSASLGHQGHPESLFIPWLGINDERNAPILFSLTFLLT